MKIWFDCTNTPHVHVVLPIINHLKKDHEIIITARDFSETVSLLEQFGIQPLVFGSHKGKSKTRKSIGLIIRSLNLHLRLPNYDLSFAPGGNYTSLVSFFRKKPSIVFSDNDISFKYLAYRFGTDFIFPKTFLISDSIRKNKKEKKHIHFFNGYKEEIYLAGFKPDPEFLENTPFQNFITIRPENLKASYISPDCKTIVPELFSFFSEENILYLPRYREEAKYAEGHPNIFIPEEPLNGLDICHYSKAILTGAGTLAREAAMMGTPAISFFPGKKLLSVDKELINQKRVFHSRNPEEIFQYVNKSHKNEHSHIHNNEVLTEFLTIIDSIITRYSS